MPKKPKKVPFLVHLTQEQDIKLGIISERTFASKSKLVRDALDEYLKSFGVEISQPLQIRGQLRLTPDSGGEAGDKDSPGADI